MALQNRWARWETLVTEPLDRGKAVITAESRALIIRLPWGGLVWHRPVAVRVERDGRAIERIPVRDITRLVQATLIGAGLIAAGVALATTNRCGERM